MVFFLDSSQLLVLERNLAKGGKKKREKTDESKRSWNLTGTGRFYEQGTQAKTPNLPNSKARKHIRDYLEKTGLMYNVLAAVLAVVTVASVHGVPSFPAYSQQCADDAGPPWADDVQAYHKGSAADPVLKNQTCPGPLKDACAQRGDAKTAFLEGPVKCNGKGWYCRILPDPNWPAIALDGDRNFGHCNRSDTDQSGHCHGSDVESTYYWWVRDHWFRQYNGRLKCCCGWDDLPQGRVVSRCDYRRLVQEGTTGSCRDANEDHNLGFEGGCNEQVRQSQFGQEIAEDESMCWEVQRFGYSESAGGGGPSPSVSPTGGPSPSVSPTSGPDPDGPEIGGGTPGPTTSQESSEPAENFLTSTVGVAIICSAGALIGLVSLAAFLSQRKPERPQEQSHDKNRAQVAQYPPI